MATKEEIAAFENALAELANSRPDIAEQLGDAPSRSQLLEVLEEFSSVIATGMASASRFALVEAISKLAPEQPAPKLISFTTRLPEPLVREVKSRAANLPGGVQALVRDALQAHLENS